MDPQGSKTGKVHFTTSPSSSSSSRRDDDDNDERSSSLLSFLRPRRSKKLVSASSNLTDASGSSCSSQKQRVFRQYIFDRIQGNSYVPTWQRNEKGAAPPLSSLRDHEVREQCHDEEAEDMTSWSNRPPHFLCFLPPCVGKWPRFCEQNEVCEWVGKIGFHAFFKYHHIRRKRVFAIGFFFNFVSLCLLVVACMAFSRNRSILTKTSFARGLMKPTISDLADTLEVRADVGFRALAITDENDWVGGDDVINFVPVCPKDLDEVLEKALCGKCRESSGMFVVSCLINLFIILKNMFSDITRMYPRYDLNCPNFAGSAMALMSVFLGLYTINTYRNRCLSELSKEVDTSIYYDLPDYISEKLPESGQIQVDIKWEAGPGLICLVVATFLRILDAICNFLVPTPSIARGRVEQERYELEFADMPEAERARRSQKLDRRLNDLRLKVKDEEENAATTTGNPMQTCGAARHLYDLESFSVPIARTKQMHPEGVEQNIVNVDQIQAVSETDENDAGSDNRQERAAGLDVEAGKEKVDESCLTVGVEEVDESELSGGAEEVDTPQLPVGVEGVDESEQGGHGWLENVSDRISSEGDEPESTKTSELEKSLKRMTGGQQEQEETSEAL